jgi:hypothetical protein
MKKKKAIIIVAVLVILLGWRTYRAIVPSGASFTPFLMARVEGPIVESPDGSIKLQVWFNDAGAAHSGNHWTWLVQDHCVFGKRVIAQGYLGAEQAVSGKPIPLNWIDNDSFSVAFLNGRYGDSQEIKLVELK